MVTLPTEAVGAGDWDVYETSEGDIVLGLRVGLSEGGREGTLDGWDVASIVGETGACEIVDGKLEGASLMKLGRRVGFSEGEREGTFDGRTIGITGAVEIIVGKWEGAPLFT